MVIKYTRHRKIVEICKIGSKVNF